MTTAPRAIRGAVAGRGRRCWRSAHWLQSLPWTLHWPTFAFWQASTAPSSAALRLLRDAAPQPVGLGAVASAPHSAGPISMTIRQPLLAQALSAPVLAAATDGPCQ